MHIYINGILATNKDLQELERRLRLGQEKAFAKCIDGTIFYKTI